VVGTPEAGHVVQYFRRADGEHCGNADCERQIDVFLFLPSASNCRRILALAQASARLRKFRRLKGKTTKQAGCQNESFHGVDQKMRPI
jgi:hypothetical protein